MGELPTGLELGVVGQKFIELRVELLAELLQRLDEPGGGEGREELCRAGGSPDVIECSRMAWHAAGKGQIENLSFDEVRRHEG
jgi:hypothetical protein